MTGTVERHLAAILATDVVDYSRLMDANEARTIAALKQHRRAVFDPTIAKQGEYVVKVTDDRFMLGFAHDH